MNAQLLKDKAAEAIRADEAQLSALSKTIHDNPECAFEEHIAAAAVANMLTAKGFTARVGIGGIITAVRATLGSGDLNIALCAEYDALPGIGHACGHNLIAAASVGAVLGLASVAEDLELTVTLLGTPAEERGGGKIELLKAGAFDNVHAALMAHPAPAPFDVAAPQTLSVAQFEAAYSGRSTHASVSPHLGINAADAMTIAQVSIGLLRQQLPVGHQVHGVVTHAGTVANVIPDYAHADFFARSGTAREVAELRERVVACFRAGAIATGCELSVMPVSDPYAELDVDSELSSLYRENAERQGRRFLDTELPAMGSTDMGNVSHAVPSIHPYFGLDCLPALPHQADFADHVNTPAAHAAMLQVACALAATAIDAAARPATRARLLSSRG